MKIAAGLYTAIIIARSSEEPGRDITYDIAIRIGKKEIIFEGVRPQLETRMTSIDDQLFIVPFPLGTRIPIHIFEEEGSITAIIGISELPFIEEC